MIEDKEILIGIVVALGVLIVLQPFTFQEAEQQKYVVELDTSQSELVNDLIEKSFINNKSAFEFWLTVWPGKVQPGSYELSKEVTDLKLVNTLTNRPHQKWVQIPEGLREEQIAERVQEKLNWSSYEKKQFLKEAEEGHLFPSTYLFKTSYSGKEIAKRMNNRFNEEVNELFDKAKQKNIRNDTLIVLASIVQREAANEEQMPLIAGIIWNRWLQEKPFEIDATLQYALGKPGDWWPEVRPKHQKIDSPYNTYKHKDRPPAPICNPGLAAVKSVIFPKETDYLYYLHDKKDKIHLAKTKEGHWQNIDRYLRFPWVYKQEKLQDLGKSEINSILKKLKEKFPDKERRLEALSLLRLGTPYRRGCLGEESTRDEDPVFQLKTTDCTAFTLTNAALLHSGSLQQAEDNMKKSNYRDEISFEDRLHFTTDRIETSPYFKNVTEKVAKDKVKKKEVVLNKVRNNGKRLIDIDWEKKTTVEYIPSEHVNKELLSKLPQSVGVAFVDESKFKLGLDVVHEGLLFDKRYLVHASTIGDKTVKVDFLNYYSQAGFDGVVLYKVL